MNSMVLVSHGIVLGPDYSQFRIYITGLHGELQTGKNNNSLALRL